MPGHPDIAIGDRAGLPVPLAGARKLCPSLHQPGTPTAATPSVAGLHPEVSYAATDINRAAGKEHPSSRVRATLGRQPMGMRFSGSTKGIGTTVAERVPHSVST